MNSAQRERRISIKGKTDYCHVYQELNSLNADDRYNTYISMDELQIYHLKSRNTKLLRCILVVKSSNKTNRLKSE